MTPDPREAKLPVWAQEILRELRRTTQAAQETRNAAIGASPADPAGLILRRTEYSGYRSTEYEFGLGNRPHVVAKMPDGAELIVEREGDSIEITAHKSITDQLVVFAGGASNVLRVGLVERVSR